MMTDWSFKEKWMWKQSHFIDPDESPIKYSQCGKCGHNKRICTVILNSATGNDIAEEKESRESKENKESNN